MALRMRLEMRPVQRLSLEQRQGLKQLLGLRQTLKDPEFPEAAKGVEGMEKAHSILRQKKLRGILVGGLSEAMWMRGKKETLESHKDVDVMVEDKPAAQEIEPLEGRIDWWIPKHAVISKADKTGSVSNIHQAWWENVFGVVLSFGLKQRENLPPGLYIPNLQWVEDMRQAEIEANIESDRVVVDREMLQLYRKKIFEKKESVRPPDAVLESLNGHVHGAGGSVGRWESRMFEIQKFDLPTIVGIHRARQQT